MESYDPLDPIQYYLNSMKTHVEWPPLEIPPHVDVPPDLAQEPDWDMEEWLSRGLASNYSSALFTPSLNATNIENLWNQVEAEFPLLPLASQAMRYLLYTAKEGYNSQLTEIVASQHPNVALESRLWTPTIIVIHKWLEKGFLKGPFDTPPFSPEKVNGLLCIPKGPSNVRVCSDFSRPAGSSFNSAVDKSFKSVLPLRISSFPAIRRAIALAGSGCLFLKHDLVDAYKKLQIHPSQLPAQQFRLGQMYFYDSCLVFGDRSAVHGFSFIHNGIITGLVLPYAQLPQELAQCCIDDLVVFAPAAQRHKLITFDKRYRYVMAEIGFELQPWDEEKLKSFGPTTAGLVLGVWIDTKSMTYNFPPRKLALLLEFIETCVEAPALTLNQLQKLCGKINYLKQVDESFSVTSGFILHQLQAYLKIHPDWSSTPISQQQPLLVLNQASRQDLLIIRSMLKMLQDRSFPLEMIRWTSHTRILYTDASGVINHGVGGVILTAPNRAFHIPLPEDVLLSGLGHVKFIPMSYRTGVLELLPIWAGLLLFASEVRHSTVLVYIDNNEAVLSLTKKTSSDFATCLMLRLICYTASILDAHVEPIHINRRSDVYSRVADDLTHGDTRSFFKTDPFGIYSYVPDLPPVNLWYKNFATTDPTSLFASIVDFIRNHRTVQYLLPNRPNLA